VQWCRSVSLGFVEIGAALDEQPDHRENAVSARER
jgi:hypothetical protein